MKTIERHGDRLCFLVPSDTPGHPPYLVDLEENKGRGRCSCRDWETRCSPRIGAGEKIAFHGGTAPHTACKHIRDVILWLGASVHAKATGHTIEQLYK